VEIIKALSVEATVISMDEPTAALSDNEVTVLYRVIDALKAKGVAIIYVSHRLQEIFDLCDVITVLKDGALVTSRPRAELDHAGLVRAMVGRPIGAFFPDPEPDTAVGPPVLTVTAGRNGLLDGLDLELRAAEDHGHAGPRRSGPAVLLEGIFGRQAYTRGRMSGDGRPVEIASARDGVGRGLALVAAGRSGTGPALSPSILDNALLALRAVFPSRTRRTRNEV